MNEIKNSQITSNISEYFNNCDMKKDYVLISGILVPIGKYKFL